MDSSALVSALMLACLSPSGPDLKSDFVPSLLPAALLAPVGSTGFRINRAGNTIYLYRDQATTSRLRCVIAVYGGEGLAFQRSSYGALMSSEEWYTKLPPHGTDDGD